jgi:CPA2 family monovalent cation:H+ antiporter-2
MEMAVLKDIVVIFALSTLVNYLFTKIKVPTIIGYLFTGIIAGPHLFGIISSAHEIELMAEIGVVLLMFTIGLEFSLNHLLKIRKIVFLGGFVQVFFTVMVTMVIARFYHITWAGALFVGFLTALSSTAVVLKILQERSELTSNYGRTVLGILIFQDLILIPLLLFTPMLGSQDSDGTQILIVIFKAVVIIGFIFLGNRWLMPRLLRAIAMTKNQELFLMSILLICLSVALLTSELGLSLAFGAFLAGLMVSESEYSHNAFGHLIPFKDTFTSFFFVSIGILLDLQFVLDHFLLVVITVLLVIISKATIAGFTAFILGHTFRGVVMVGVALSQVGEFSFVLARMGLDYEIVSEFHYQLFLSVAVITMSVTPIHMLGSKRMANTLLKLPLPKVLVDGLFPLPAVDIPVLSNHVVFIGKDSRALSLSVMAKSMKLPYVSIVFDPASARKRQLKGEMVIYGDAVNVPILQKAHADAAAIIVVSVGNLITSMAIVEQLRRLSQRAFILVRTKKVEDIEELYKLGANQVIPEEFETAIELFERVLSKLLVPRREISRVVSRIRDDHYGIFLEKEETKGLELISRYANIEITAIKLDETSFVIGKSLLEVQFRRAFGVTLVAIVRKDELLEHPEPEMRFEKGDTAYIMGKPEQVARAAELFSRKESVTS